MIEGPLRRLIGVDAREEDFFGFFREITVHENVGTSRATHPPHERGKSRVVKGVVGAGRDPEKLDLRVRAEGTVQVGDAHAVGNLHESDCDMQW